MKIAIVGFGGMGGYHYKRVKVIDGMSVKGVYDIEPERNAAAALEGLFVYGSYRDIANDSEIGGVIIATPNDSHIFYIKYFASAGKKILCEKPVTMNAASFKRMADKLGGAIFTVNQNRRFDLDFLTARQVIKSQVIGKVYRIESRVTGANGIPGGWRKLKSQGGGMMLDWGVHLIDQICMLFPVIESLSCVYSYALGFDVEDGFILTLNTPEKVQIVIEVQTNDYIGVPRWKIFGLDGSAVIENWNLDGKITVPVYNGDVETVAINAGNGLTKTMAYRHHDSVENLPLPSVTTDMDAIYKNFKSATTAGDLIVKSNEVLRVLRIMDACFKSANQSGALIKLKEG